MSVIRWVVSYSVEDSDGPIGGRDLLRTHLLKSIHTLPERFKDFHFDGTWGVKEVAEDFTVHDVIAELGNGPKSSSSGLKRFFDWGPVRPLHVVVWVATMVLSADAIWKFFNP